MSNLRASRSGKRKKLESKREAKGSWDTLWWRLGQKIHEYLLLRVPRSPWIQNIPALPVLPKAWLFSISWCPCMLTKRCILCEVTWVISFQPQDQGNFQIPEKVLCKYLSLPCQAGHKLKDQRTLSWASSQLQMTLLFSQHEVESPFLRASFPAMSLVLASCLLANFSPSCFFRHRGERRNRKPVIPGLAQRALKIESCLLNPSSLLGSCYY